MANLLAYSMFHDLLLRSPAVKHGATDGALTLNTVKRYRPEMSLPVWNHEMVVFDFETTGLDSEVDEIIEIGGIRLRGGQVVAEFSTLVEPDQPLTDLITEITGITADMLVNQPKIAEVLPRFLEFIDGAILVAHNAEFDMGFLTKQSFQLGVELFWPCFCTLKMARSLLPDLESKNLDTLANHYGLTFESRHRSVGDCKVTAGVLECFFREFLSQRTTWSELSPYAIC